MFSTAFWSRTAERAAKTAAQVFITAVGVAASLSWAAPNWSSIAQMAGISAALSVAFSLVSLRLGPPDDPSLL